MSPHKRGPKKKFDNIIYIIYDNCSQNKSTMEFKRIRINNTIQYNTISNTIQNKLDLILKHKIQNLVLPFNLVVPQLQSGKWQASGLQGTALPPGLTSCN